MGDKELSRWIEEGISKGNSLEYLKNYLIKEGYPKENIDHAINLFPKPKRKVFWIIFISLIALSFIVGAIILFNSNSFKSKQDLSLDKQEGLGGYNFEGKLETDPTIVRVEEEIIENCGGIICDNFHECIENKCFLKNSEYKVALIYLFEDPETYNNDWKENLENIIPKAKNSLKLLTEDKIDLSIDILGEYQTNKYCWNPSKIGVKFNHDENFSSSHALPGSRFDSEILGFSTVKGLESPIEIEDCEKCDYRKQLKETIGEGDKICTGIGLNNFVNPGECDAVAKVFRCDGSTGKKILDCQFCGCQEGDVCNEYGGCSPQPIDSYEMYISCENPLSSKNISFAYDKIFLSEISTFFNFSYEDYDEFIFVIGNFGIPLEDEPNFLDWRCSPRTITEGFITGNKIFIGENSLMESQNDYFIDCGPQKQKFYSDVGWKIIPHEILHDFGARDVYETGLELSYGGSYREEALEIDSHTDKSIMGNQEKDCMEEDATEKDGEMCSLQELESVYLDKYNRQLIGLE